MRIFRYWEKKEESFLNKAGQREVFACYGGSNESPAAAFADASARAQRVLSRIVGYALSQDDYEADIREEIVRAIDARNVVTRNRYGAEILNSSEVMFIDVDWAPPSWPSWQDFCAWFRGNPPAVTRRKKLSEFVARKAAELDLTRIGVRAYDTHSGMRLIITGRPFDPCSSEVADLMKHFAADHLYGILCRKQGCFRARLTPKPYRMRMRTIRVTFPRSAEQQTLLDSWISDYDVTRTEYATCRFVREWGLSSGHPVISFHDVATGALSGRRLA
jgi:hypothetical protein